MKATKTAKTKKSKRFAFAGLVIPLALCAGICVYLFVMGNGSHFVGGDHHNANLPGDYFGIVYKGGFIVPILMTLLLTVLTFTIERQLTISRASGKGNVGNFVQNIKNFLANNDIDGAIEACDKQKGSVANVIRAVVVKYRVLESDDSMVKDQKLTSLQKEIEEATSLELPSLEENLVVLATITSLATLMGLLGTVLGMIRAFAALANAGAPDSVALATGISEALVNTAFGIGTSVLAVIFYNVFTSKIDKLTYAIDEAGFSIVQSYAANHK
ncbi:MAG: MotA/TolQ/ExbB proton channel family protein [Bacteroidota bacterium]|nr:MotA/TolQ/ExbB proton channel family protein [Bacteroidota bacterium]